MKRVSFRRLKLYISGNAQTEAPEYDRTALEARLGFGDWTLTLNGVEYPCSVPLSDYLEAGWVMEKAPESIASGKRAAGEVYLRKDVLTTLIPGYVYNPFPVALTPEHCFVAECLLVFDADDAFALRNAEGDFEISGSNTRTEVIAKLEAGEDFESLIAEYGEDPGMQNEPTMSRGY